MGENFAQIVLNGQLLMAIPIAVPAGLISFASPCVLPLVPGYLAYVGGMAGQEGAHPRRRRLTGVGPFVLGFSVVFISYGAAFGAAGYWLVPWQDPITRALGIVVIIMEIRTVNRVSGSVLILIGVLMASGVWTMWIYSMQALIGGVELPI
ncbi:cytochrome c biogenesis CcdA family protein [Cryobacterium mannosilyticum]|uniref:Uncharacterized protein n=1 Tax=Cryobacterium mannosilyticum TaxID=1259190 RepID=A0A4R8WC31_9MICO|nr:cytochrome c biogenesis protein CcdA [Cryobacterium mannosilyticum]TFC06813.1 hypothetical protein E3O32_03680 [Cryobacterium mannosilyticum]